MEPSRVLRELSPPLVFIRNFFIIFVDAVFTTLLEPLFTNAFEVNAQTSARPCLWRARIAN